MPEACYPIATAANPTPPACGRDRRGGESALGSSSPVHPVPTAIMPTTNSPRSDPVTDNDGPTPGKPRGRSLWTWNDINLVLDVVLMVLFAAECFAAVIVRHVFPPGPGAAGWKLWGLDYDAWAGIQFGLLAALAGGILLHVMFHWSWVCTMVAGRWSGRPKGRVDQGMQTIYGVILLIALLLSVGIPVAAAVLTVQPPA